ncbi:diaminopimelate epimerase [Granulicella paludicola]|uniref:diaminopimelate epimerase n=1 Tax=Granulicella paludicola TaxID=474951 RepID=UPI0021DF62A4|nr:diaminopimelate epimerase [Granulicella paludicola]
MSAVDGNVVKFVKAHACGNDFLVIEEALAQGKHAAMARKLCARNTGIGADGIEFLDRRADGTFFLRLFNADGSEAELSGNGTRCVAAWLAASEGIEQIALGTHGGVRSCRVVERKGAEWWIESGMGVPRVMPRKIEIAGVDGVIDGAMVNVGNPHYVIFVDNDDFSSHGQSWQALGAKIAVDSLFKFGTNVEFVRVRSKDEIEFRIFERGCGPTTSSGTGTCASTSASMSLRETARTLSAIAQGGTQQVVWPDAQSEMLLTGPAEIVCTGEVEF